MHDMQDSCLFTDLKTASISNQCINGSFRFVQVLHENGPSLKPVRNACMAIAGCHEHLSIEDGEMFLEEFLLHYGFGELVTWWVSFPVVGMPVFLPQISREKETLMAFTKRTVILAILCFILIQETVKESAATVAARHQGPIGATEHVTLAARGATVCHLEHLGTDKCAPAMIT
ncbi:hypothetical protein RIF29_18431 [Crotalaria pallida]|uniref:Uncharacterized protein n=1 Tax=Crotalaria pallida TaxID=3830 RepID=A0AAN9FJV5_CROPI